MANPAQVVAIFQNQIRTTLTLYDELVVAVDQKKRQKSLETMLAEQCVLALAVAWEAFVHNLMISYIEQNPQSCIRHHQDKVAQSIEAKNKHFAKWVTIKPPNVLSRGQIELLIDPNGWNITANSADALAVIANQFLTAPYAKKFSLADNDRAFVDFLIATRNYLSHRSTGALLIMKKRVRELYDVDASSPLNGTITTVGAYLKTIPSGTVSSRTRLVGQQLIALAEGLV